VTDPSETNKELLEENNLLKQRIKELEQLESMHRLAAEDALRITFKATPVGLSIMKGRVFRSVNQAWCDITGYSETDLIGHTTRILYENEAEYKRVERELHPKLRESGIASVQTKHRRKDGIICDIVLTAALLQSETPSLEMVVVIEDITDRRQKEEALRESEQALRTIFDNTYDAIFIHDLEGRILDCNQKMLDLYGVTREKALSSTILGDFLTPEDALNQHRERWNRLAQGETFEFEWKARRLSDGSSFDTEVALKRIVLGNRPLVLANVRDITERKRAEEERNSLQKLLLRAEKMEALGALAGGVAHDLNNILGIMVGYSELLLEMLPQENPLKKYAENILQSSLRSTAIVQDLLILARRGVVVSEIVNLNKVISDYLQSPEFAKLSFYHPDVKISTNLETLILNIKGSPVHLFKTIMNLVSNAVESIPGQGEVMIRTENRHMDKPIQGDEEVQEGDYLVLMVSDTGSGIAANDLGKIFDPFYTRKVMGRSGTGLGLAVVWGTVKDHHGYIDVQSEEGRGSSFTLYFPVTREEPVEVGKTASTVIYMGKGESILVVDDVREQRELATNMLERLKYQVEAVAGGEEAIEYLKYKKADLVVLDMIMDPGIDGMETYRRILEINPGQKAVIVSGFSETDRVRDAQKMGAGTFVRKPYILEKIGLAVRHELDRK